MKSAATLLALLAPLSAHAAETGALVRFVSCPVYRDADSGKKSGCWLADDPATGLRWDVSHSPYKPDVGMGVLVEGRVSAEAPTACGAPVLEPVRTSRLDTSCVRHVLPAEGYPGRKFKLPPRNIQPLSVARPVPPGPYAERTFVTYFEFDRDFLVYQYDDFIIDNAVTWLRAAKPKKLIITGYAATRPETVTGRKLAERPQVAQQRADAMAETLSRLLPGLPIETRAKLAAQPTDHPDADGIPGQSQRRAEIRAVF